MKKIVIFISGRGSNMQRIIEETKSGILKDSLEVSLVFSDKKEAKGLQTAKEYGIPVANISSKGKSRKEFDTELINLLKKIDFDYIVLAGYMRILTKEFVNTFPKQIINIHPADTRRHQGLHAYEWAFENKLKATKITIHYVDEGMDTGQIIAQKEVNLTNTKTLEEVEKKGLKVEHEFYSKILYNLTNKTN